MTQFGLDGARLRVYNPLPGMDSSHGRLRRSAQDEASDVSRTILFCCVSLLAISCGCSRSRPLLAPPGPIRQQQYGASIHDPYTDNELGPAVVGGRPRDFMEPLAEPVRSRPLRNNSNGQ